MPNTPIYSEYIISSSGYLVYKTPINSSYNTSTFKEMQSHNKKQSSKFCTHLPASCKRYLAIFISFLTFAVSYATTYNYVLEVGKSKTLSPGSHCFSANVSDPSILNFTLDPQGKEVVVTALRPGRATCNINYLSGSTGYWNTYIIEVIDLVSIVIPQSLNIKVGESYKFQPLINDSRMVDYLLKWDCLDNSIATIDDDTSREVPLPGNYNFPVTKTEYIRGGNLVSHKPGRTQVICTYKNISAVCQLEVEPIETSEIIFENNIYKISEFQNTQIHPVILPENATNKEIIWQSSNASVALVDSKGTVTALNEGKTIISATAKDGSQISGNYLLVVEPEEKETVEIEFIIDNFSQVCTKIQKGSSFALKVLPPTDKWRLESFTVNGIDATNQLINGEYSINTVEHPITLQASFTYNGILSFYDTTNVLDSILDNSGIIISKDNNQLCISNLNINSKISIYTIGGHLIGSYTSQNNTLRIDLDSNYYIIAIDGNYFKIKL